MATATFYHPELGTENSQIQLSTLESAHAIKSRRLRQGNRVKVINGRGLVASGSIIQADKQTVSVQINTHEQFKQVKPVAIATAIPKGDRQRTMIDMLTQLGVSQVFPLDCERSVTRFKSTLLDKWQRWAIEACKQSQNPWLPEIEAGISIDQALSLPYLTIAYADGRGQRLCDINLAESDVETKALLILIGPEGGFSEKEQQQLRGHNCAAISLGRTILRTELAAVTALVHAFMKEN